MNLNLCLATKECISISISIFDDCNYFLLAFHPNLYHVVLNMCIIVCARFGAHKLDDKLLPNPLTYQHVVFKLAFTIT